MIIKGIVGSEGIAIANVYKLETRQTKLVRETKNSAKEIEKLDNSIAKTRVQLEKIVKNLTKKVGKNEAEVFDAHIQILEDPMILEETKKEIEESKATAEYAVQLIFTKYSNMFSSMQDTYMQQRAIDIKDIQTRLINVIIGAESKTSIKSMSNIIVVAHELTPSDTVSMDRSKVKGIAIEKGGATSHATIISRTLGIPAVVDLGEGFLDKVENGDQIIIDGQNGHIILKPTAEELNKYRRKISEFNKEQVKINKYINKQAITKDGIKIVVKANIGSPTDAIKGYEFGADGVGLFRTEFLYMNNSHWPTEEEMFQSYKEVLALNPKKEVVIRTLDIGGDKTLSYFKFQHEDNPFLGMRSIRFSLKRSDIFKTQLRALIRASNYGTLSIMFPMISIPSEFRAAKTLFEKCYEEVKKKYPVSSRSKIKLGMMIEVPASALYSDCFVKMADFFSIGSNDLIQYTMAADRVSEPIRYLYQPQHPSIMRLLGMTIMAGRINNIPVSLCGEAASDSKMIPLLLGLGLRIFSVSPSLVPVVKKHLSELSYEECRQKVRKAVEINGIFKIIKELKIKD